MLFYLQVGYCSPTLKRKGSDTLFYFVEYEARVKSKPTCHNAPPPDWLAREVRSCQQAGRETLAPRRRTTTAACAQRRERSGKLVGTHEHDFKQHARMWICHEITCIKVKYSTVTGTSL